MPVDRVVAAVRGDIPERLLGREPVRHGDHREWQEVGHNGSGSEPLVECCQRIFAGAVGTAVDKPIIEKFG